MPLPRSCDGCPGSLHSEGLALQPLTSFCSPVASSTVFCPPCVPSKGPPPGSPAPDCTVVRWRAFTVANDGPLAVRSYAATAVRGAVRPGSGVLPARSGSPGPQEGWRRCRGPVCQLPIWLGAAHQRLPGAAGSGRGGPRAHRCLQRPPIAGPQAATHLAALPPPTARPLPARCLAASAVVSCRATPSPSRSTS